MCIRGGSGLQRDRQPDAYELYTGANPPLQLCPSTLNLTLWLFLRTNLWLFIEAWEGRIFLFQANHLDVCVCLLGRSLESR